MLDYVSFVFPSILFHYYYLEYFDYWLHLYCYNHSISAEKSFGLKHAHGITVTIENELSNQSSNPGQFALMLSEKAWHYYYLEYLYYCPHLYCYNRNVSADMSFSLLWVFHIKLRRPHKISNLTLYLNPRGRLFQFC